MTSIRASSVPLLLACNGSAQDGVMQIETANEAGPLGSAAHEGIAQFVRDGTYADVNKLAEGYRLSNPDDLSAMIAIGRNAWTDLAHHLPNPVVEQALSIKLDEDIELTSHMDVFSPVGETACVVDWKTGRKDRGYFDQLRAYALIACETYKLPRWSISLVWLRNGERDTRSGTLAELAQFKQSVIDAVRSRNSQKYCIGEHCEYCPRFHDCPARSALVRRATGDIASIDQGDIRAMAAGGQLRDVYAGVRCIQKACNDWLDQLKAEIRVGGPIAMPDGKSVGLKLVTRDIIEPVTAWPIVTAPEYLPDDEIGPAVRLSKTAILDAVGKKAPRGQKARLKEQLMQELREAGAVTQRIEEHIDFPRSNSQESQL